MDPQMDENELKNKLREGFLRLPKVVQDAITSADVEKALRALADQNKLHIDQWQLLENEVMLTLLGFQPPEDLAKNLETDLEISADMAHSLAEQISKIVFEPIRAQLERALEHPEAKAAEQGAIEQARAAVLSQKERGVPEEIEVKPQSPAVTPATPPPPPPSGKAARAPVSEAYRAGESSQSRKSVHDDPYRETPQ